jgi:hypothetical protein
MDDTALLSSTFGRLFPAAPIRSKGGEAAAKARSWPVFFANADGGRSYSAFCNPGGLKFFVPARGRGV